MLVACPCCRMLLCTLLTLANSARLPLTHGIVLLCQLSRCWALLAPCNLSTSTHLVLPTAYHGIYWPAFWSSDEADVLASCLHDYTPEIHWNPYMARKDGAVIIWSRGRGWGQQGTKEFNCLKKVTAKIDPNVFKGREVRCFFIEKWRQVNSLIVCKLMRTFTLWVTTTRLAAVIIVQM